MNILITGGAGYIGSAAAETLIKQGHQVTVYDSLVTGHREAIPEEARFIHADLGDEDILIRTLEDTTYDAVMHFAAFIEAGESMKEPGRFFNNNLINSLRLIAAAVEVGITRFVFSSSAAVYASSDEPLTESSPLGPSNVYGQTKLMFEQALSWYLQIHGLRYAALRYFNAAGALPGRGEAHKPESHLIPLVLQVASGQRDSISIFGTDYPTPDGTAIRDYIHIADLISAHVVALEALSQRKRMIYNLGNGMGYSVREVINTARDITRHPIPIIESPRRQGDAPRLVASSDLIQKELGWKPKIPGLKEIIASSWEWHSSHPQGYREAGEN